MQTERHPLEPFLPDGARILMAGSFPPPRERWSMQFYYPNRQNDMWHIWSLLASGDRNYLYKENGKEFDVEKIKAFCTQIGLALTDTAVEVRRMKGNASDAFLEVVEPRNFEALLAQLPYCNTIVLTGDKAVKTLAQSVGYKTIPVGGYIKTVMCGREIKIWRMPSSSRAYPLSLERKVEAYRKVVEELGIAF